MASATRAAKTRTPPNPAIAALRTLTPEETAEVIGVTVKTLENWRIAGGGPDFMPISHNVVRYRPAAIERWFEQKERKTRAGEAA